MCQACGECSLPSSHTCNTRTQIAGVLAKTAEIIVRREDRRLHLRRATSCLWKKGKLSLLTHHVLSDSVAVPTVFATFDYQLTYVDGSNPWMRPVPCSRCSLKARRPGQLDIWRLLSPGRASLSQRTQVNALGQSLLGCKQPLENPREYKIAHLMG